MKQRNNSKKPFFLLQSQPKYRHLRRKPSDSTRSSNGNEDILEEDYGLAYKDQYDCCYYGDLKINDDSLPKCFEADSECQRVSSQRENLMISILLFIIVAVIVVFVIAYCYKKQRAYKKAIEDEEMRENLGLPAMRQKDTNRDVSLDCNKQSIESNSNDKPNKRGSKLTVIDLSPVHEQDDH